MAKIFAALGAEDFKSNPLPDELLDQCEETIGLNRQDPEFRRYIADIVMLSSVVHERPLERPGDVRKQHAIVEKRARTAAAELKRLTEAITTFGPLCYLSETTLFRLNRDVVIPGLLDLAEVAQRATAECQDRGGRSKMAGFDFFVRFLADAFGRATERRAGITWNAHRSRYEGRFWDLLESVLPYALAYAGDGFAPIETGARGKQVQRILSAMDKTH
jgi:hypothetical protein